MPHTPPTANSPTKSERAYYEKLVGRKITGIHWQDMEGQLLPVLVLDGPLTSEGNIPSAAVFADPEGNGPGHLDHQL